MSKKNTAKAGKPGFFSKAWAGIKEFFRKKMVYLKRNPSVIPLLMLLASFLVYSMNLTLFSDTTARVGGSNMGLAQFVIMLLGALSMVCMMNAFPRRKKPNILMLVVLFVMLAIIVFADYHYRSQIILRVNSAQNPLSWEGEYVYIHQAYDLLLTHMIMIIVSAALVALLPVYSKLLRKVKTSIDVEDNGEMADIELSAE